MRNSGKEIGRISSDDLPAEVVWSGSCSGGGRSIVCCKFVERTTGYNCGAQVRLSVVE